MQEVCVSWVDLKKAYGFNKPYDFNLAIPALLALGFFILFIIMVAWGLSREDNSRLIPSDFIFMSMCSLGSSLQRWRLESAGYIGRC